MLKKITTSFCSLLALGATAFGAEEPGVQKLHLIQDDAQDYMVSKIYTLKYVQSNDITPFVMGIVMRYNINSTVNCIVTNNNIQMLTVTCPIKMMPYVDDFIAKVDRNIELDGKVPGDIVKGTGITRAVYRPKYRSAQGMLNVLVNSVIGEGPFGSLYTWDATTNQIYWKDNSSNTQYVYQFLGFIDRPAPQISFQLKLYEVRDSDLKDIGIEYLAWKNGPGLNIFQAAYDAFSVTSGGSAAITAISGPVGGFFTAPQFDASFIRFLGQNGKAEVTNTANLTVSNSDTNTYTIYFNPQQQNITKDTSDNDKASVVISGLPTNQIELDIIQPIVNIHYGQTQAGYPATEAFTVNNYNPGVYTKYKGTVFFGYNIVTNYVVERNNVGSELVESSQISSSMLLELNKEVTVAQWDNEQEVEQTIGVPWLSQVPILKYLFSTTTTSKEKTKVYLTVTAQMLNTSDPDGKKVGELIRIK